MKRLICWLLTVIIAFSLSGCDSGEQNAVSFYYCRNTVQYQYFEEDAVICAEQRDLQGHRDDLRYMVGLYLAGPMPEGLITPFSKSTKLLSVQKEEDQILIELSDHSKILKDSEFTLACAALTMTCMDFTPCSNVSISSGGRSVTMNADSIILSDILPQQETIGG